MLFRYFKYQLNFFLIKYAKINKFKFYNLNLFISFELVGEIIFIYNGNSFMPLKIKQNMLGFQLKDFVFVKKRAVFKKITKNLKKKKK